PALHSFPTRRSSDLFRFNDPVFATLERVAAPQVVVGMAALVGFLAAIWIRRRSTEGSSDAFAWPMAASLLCAPVVYPWYLLWLLPFMRSTSTLPIIIWTLSIIPTYYVWHLRAVGRDRKSTRLNSSHVSISYAVFCLKKKTNNQHTIHISTHCSSRRY